MSLTTQRGTAVDFSEPSPPIFVDEALISPAEVEAERREFAAASTRRAEVSAALLDEAVDGALQLPEKDRLRVAWPTGPLLDPAARKRVGERIAQERAEEAQLRAAGLLDDDRKAR